MASRAGKDDGAKGSEDSGGEAAEAVPGGGVEAAAFPGGVEEGGDALGSEVVDIAPEERRGHCKWFNVAKGWGFITPDDGGQDVFVHQSVIQMSGFRSLGELEEVIFETRESDKGLEATKVRAPGGGDCQGSARRPPNSRRRNRRLRCYNCGEFANHIAARCELGPQPKRCHSCRSEGHLVADCPERAAAAGSPQAQETAPSGAPSQSPSQETS